MRIDWCSYNYRDFDGYGRYAGRLIQALQRLGHEVNPLFAEMVNAPAWLKERWGIARDTFTISCLPPLYLQDAPSGGRHWLITMTEGSQAPDGWADIINARNIERVIVPCEHNAKAFREGGVKAPIHVIPGGTDPDEFSILPEKSRKNLGKISEKSPYTFLALADRGARKGWTEVYAAFYKAFGTPQDTPDVKLIIKARPESNDLLDLISHAENLDPRLQIIQADMDMRELYAMADCFAFPSRSEGWGMPPREFAMQGGPVITQCHSGMDDRHAEQWAQALYGGKLEPIPTQFEHIKGEWMRASVEELVEAMRMHYECPEWGMQKGHAAARWLRANQTWEHSAQMLLDLIEEYS